MPRIGTEQKAMILAEASMAPDELVAKRYAINERTLQRYRKELEGDTERATELSRLVDEKKALLSDDWADTAVSFLRTSIAKLEHLVSQADKTQIREVAGAIKIVGELDVVRSAVGKNGEQPATNQPGREAPEASGHAPVH